MRLEFGKQFSAGKEKASRIARAGVVLAKDVANKAKTEVNARAQKTFDESAQLSSLRNKTNQLKGQAQDRLAEVRTTIASIKNDPKGAMSTATGAAKSAAAPHIQKVTNSVKTQATRAREVVEERAAETQAHITHRAVGIIAQSLWRYVSDPKTFEELRTQLSQTIPSAITSRATAINTDGLTPQRQLREIVTPEGLDGIQAPAFETAALLADRATVFSGWLVANALNRYLRLTGEEVIQRAHIDSIVTGTIVAPSMQFAGRTAGTIYQNARDAFQSRFTSGSTAPSTTA